MRVFFFSTCLAGGAYADTCVNSIKLLQREGVEVVFKKDQTCCGQPAFNSGYYDEARKVALHQINLFKGTEPIVLPSGSCAGMMKVDYIELFKGTEHEEAAREFASRVYELSEFLDSVLKVKYIDRGNKVKVTWHSNCHALRVAKSINAAKNIIRSLDNVELIELEREEECCGFGGTFSVKEPEISNAMVSKKVEDIENQEVEYVLVADAGCLMNISGAMKKQNSKTKAVHFYDFLMSRID